MHVRFAALSALAVGLVCVSGCGGGAKEKALLYGVFDLSKSYSPEINEEHAQTATFLGLKFCERHKSRGQIIMSGITPASEIDAPLKPVACPKCPNETQCRTAMIRFKPQLEAAILEVTAYEPELPGSDVLGAIHQAARVGFDRLDPDVGYLVVFSDMQHTGEGMRNCVRNKNGRDGRCLDLYYRAHPDHGGGAPGLSGVAAYIVGFGINISGPLAGRERQNYKALWRKFFSREEARRCWMEAKFPIGTLADGTRGVRDEDFTPECTQTF